MEIVMLQPLNVDKDIIDTLANPLIEKGHIFKPCYEEIYSDQEKINKAKNADIVITANSPLTKEVIKGCRNLKMISVAFTGIDHIDTEVCKERKILISNAAGYCTYAVAELTFGLIFSVLRKICKCNNLCRKSLTKEGNIGNEIYGKTLGIIGTGAIGTKVAEYAKVFGCKLLGYSRSINHSAHALGVEYVDLDTLLSNSDIVTVHTPLTPETKLLLSKEKIDKMQPNSILINVARGGVLDSEALAHSLNTGKIAGAGIDVFEMEPPIPLSHPLLNSKNIVLTPHVGFATKESLERRASITIDNVIKWINKKPQNVMLK